MEGYLLTALAWFCEADRADLDRDRHLRAAEAGQL